MFKIRRRRDIAGNLGLALVYGTVPVIGTPLLALVLLVVGLGLVLAAEVHRPARGGVDRRAVAAVQRKAVRP